jgi:hypothetical protein
VKNLEQRFQSSKILRGAGGSELGSWIDRFILDFAALSSSEELMLFGLAIVMDDFSLLFSRLLLLLTLEVVSTGLYFVGIDLVAMEE